MNRWILLTVATVGLVVLSGCSLLSEDTLSYEAASAGVGADALVEAGYGEFRSEALREEHTVSVGGESRTLRLSNYVGEYRRDLGGGDVGGFAVLATPQAQVAGQEVNPLDSLSPAELVTTVPNPYGTVSDVRETGSRTLVVLGDETTVRTFRGVGETDSEPREIAIHVTKVRHDGDILLASAVYPAEYDETARVDVLFRGVEHPLSASDGGDGGDGSDGEARAVSIAELTANPDAYVGQRVAVEGYYAGRSAPMLVADYEDVLSNEALPANGYVPLDAAEFPERLSAETEGYTVRVEGVVRAVKLPSLADETDEERASVWRSRVSVAVDAVDVRGIEGRVVDLREEPVTTFEVPKLIYARDECRFAVVLSGGINDWNNHDRYWEGTVQTYQAMNGTYGIPDDQIYVNYFDGTPDALVDGRNIVDAGADEANVTATFAALESRVAACESSPGKGTRSEVMIFTYNHGGQDTGKNLMGTEVLTPDELRDHLVDLRIAGLDEANVMMMQCFSGHFIDLTAGMSGRTTKDSVTAIATAAKNDELSWGKSFGWEFVAALAGSYPNGTVVDADANGDGRVTWGEAFVYGRTHDKYGPNGEDRESPQFFSNARWIDPDGDGVHSDYDSQPLTYNPNQ